MAMLRLVYKKDGVMKFISHLDMVRLTERTFRRANVPLSFSKGFNPHPKISFGAPLSVGVSSEYELLDVELEEEIDVEKFLSEQKSFSPEGITFIQGVYIDKSNSLMSMLTDATYMMKTSPIKYSVEELSAKVEEFLKSETIMIEKLNKKKQLKEVDIKPLIGELVLLKSDDEELISKVTVASGSNGNLKPEVLLKAFYDFLGAEFEEHFVRIHRTMLYGRIDDKKVPLLDMK